MNIRRAVVTGVGYAVLASAYVYTAMKMSVERMLDPLAPRRNWRVVRHDDLRIRVPPVWGEAEPAEGGGIVIHNRPRQHRIDGDAIWYSSAVELHVHPGGSRPLPQSVSMREHRRRIATKGRSFDLCLRLANGVTGQQDRLARLALSSAEVVTSDLLKRGGTRRFE
jgi:hypothetical protein